MGGGRSAHKIMETMTAKDVIRQVASMYDVTVKQVMSRSRTNTLADCRTVICHTLCKTYGMGYSDVGRIIHRSHADVIHHVDKGNDWLIMPYLNKRGSRAIIAMQSGNRQGIV